MRSAPDAELESRLANGERYLASNPDDRSAQELYWGLTAEYVSLIEQRQREAEIKAIVLDLPPNVRWQRAGSDTIHSTVRVVYSGQPVDAADITRDELADLLATRRAMIEVKERVWHIT